MPEIVAGFVRLWREDRGAVYVVVGVLAIQFGLWVWLRRRTWVPLHKASKHLSALAGFARTDPHRAATHAALSGGRVERAWRRAWGNLPGIAGSDPVSPTRGEVDPSEAFASAAILPESYNQRLDGAAPGTFTAMGILGTFVGLILGFVRIDPEVATTNVSPLLGDMVVAFLNSLIGVVLSIAWSLRARVVRHTFDQACGAVAEALHDADRSPPESAALLSSMNQRLRELAESTARSSGELLSSLSTRVGESVASVVDLPFNKLHERIARLDELIGQTSVQQAELHRDLVLTATRVEEVHRDLADGIARAGAIVESFNSTLGGMTTASDRLDTVSRSLTDLTGSLSEGTLRLEGFVTGMEALRGPLGELETALNAQQQALASTSARFEGATLSLEATVGTIRDMASSTARESAASVQVELQVAIEAMNREMVRLTQSNVEAYESATTRVIDVMDTRVSDLTDRISAELTTLSGRLPEAVETMHLSTKRMQEQLTSANQSISEALRELSTRTPEALRAQLEQFDQALARAMDHFSGTLLQWDGKVEELAVLARSIESLSTGLRDRPATR